MERHTFYLLLGGWTLLGLSVFFLLLFVSAPYGRHSRKGWGPMVPNRLGWILMELPSPLVFTLAFLSGPRGVEPVTWVFFALYAGHYLNRSLIYPLRTRTGGKQMPVLVAFMAVVFNLVNGYMNGTWFSALAPQYTWEWLTDPRFILGFLFWVSGFLLNLWADQRLLALRSGGKKGYYIPRGGMFDRVSCPNFLGEIVEWSGFALLTWSPAAAVFALWTFFNLVPRALDHHRWYRRTFPDYPPGRKAVLPWLL